MKQRILTILLAIVSLVSLASPVAAVNVTGDCNALGLSDSECKIFQEDQLSGKNGAVTNAIRTALMVLVGVAVIVIVIAGIQFSISQGDAGRVKKARNAILYAVVGLAVALSAYAIVELVANNFLG